MDIQKFRVLVEEALEQIPNRFLTLMDNVVVMVEDESLKRQRLALLGKLARAFKRVADLSEIQS